jgi:hypothetical protein
MGKITKMARANYVGDAIGKSPMAGYTAGQAHIFL